jgi:endonuclease YncB( thermonuclease family)
MVSMARKKRPDIFDDEISVRYFQEAKTALEHILIDLKGDPSITFQGRKITQDALLMASWLWMEELGPAVVAKGLARHVARLDKLAASRKAAQGIADAEKKPGHSQGELTIPGSPSEKRKGAS